MLIPRSSLFLLCAGYQYLMSRGMAAGVVLPVRPFSPFSGFFCAQRPYFLAQNLARDREYHESPQAYGLAQQTLSKCLSFHP